ncbi:hypothetical protein [Lewinella sp. IMCC34183]|uniref:hypothetical protein n=1 Tax=Lewinella sp. IMCC34183 TaxID=2248762 RepID=UPI0013009E66|nr:hypothetical protein [Lewinella sp. IMCC34183]
MTHPSKIKFLSAVLVLLVASATCSGFLVGRTVKLQQEGKFEEMAHVGEQIVDIGSAVGRGMDVVRRVILR